MRLRTLPITQILVLLVLSVTEVAADDAPVVPTQSGTVVPVFEQYIKLVSEQVDIYLDRGAYRVEVAYEFRNTGPETEITMGFPNETDWMYGRSIDEFRAWVDGIEQAVYRKVYRVSDKPYGPGTAPDLFYECFDIAFDAGASRSVRNEYRQEYVVDYGRTSEQATYVLTTGAYWKGSIDSITVNVHFTRPRHDYEGRTIIFPPGEVDDSRQRLPGIRIEPEPTGTFPGGVQIVLEDTEPDRDIEITMPPPVTSYARATSELSPDRVSYTADNVLDDDRATSWVEGVAGDGIGERITVRLSASAAGGKIEGDYLVRSIGIVNGYAATERLYYDNNRVRSARVEYISASSNRRDAGSFTWRLRETMEVQYFDFAAPVPMNEIALTIASVYRGRRFDDTCIAELIVVPAE